MIFYYSGVFTFGGITLENLYASSLTPAFLKTLLLIKKWVDLHMRALYHDNLSFSPEISDCIMKSIKLL